jgi:hypothetical protein
MQNKTDNMTSIIYFFRNVLIVEHHVVEYMNAHIQCKLDNKYVYNLFNKLHTDVFNIK